MTALTESFSTERLLLRRPVLSDVEAIFEYASDPEVTRFMDWPRHTVIDTVKDYVHECASLWDKAEEFTWMVTVPPSTRPIGGISCRIDGHRAEFGYVLGRRFWGQGFATEAAIAVVTMLSAMNAIYRISATCDTGNTASARVLTKAGLTCEGILRAWAIRPNLSGTPRDAFVYARLTPRADF